MNTRTNVKTLLSIAFVAMAVMATSANAEITFDGSVSWDISAGTGTLNAGDSDKLVVIVTGEHNFGNTSGNVNYVTYDGVGLIQATNLDPVDSTSITASDIWYLDNPGSVHTDGTIAASVNGNNYVFTAFALSGTDPGVGATAISDLNSKSVDLTTTINGSFVIAYLTMGGDHETDNRSHRNMANVTSVDADVPLTELSAIAVGSQYSGHVTGYVNGVSAGTETYSFTGGDNYGVYTIAAEFPPYIPDPNLPSVDLGKSWITWSGQPVTLDPTVVNNDTQVPQRSLSYTWSANPADGVEFYPNANVQSPDVIIIKNANTGDATTVELTLAATLEGLGTIEEVMNIQVFDDACNASIGSGSVIAGAGDFNRNCFTDIDDFALLAAEWLVDYDTAELSMLAESWLDGEVLTAPVITEVTVPDVTGQSQSAAKSMLTGAGFTASSVYEYDEDIPLDYVIAQSPAADAEVPDGINVTLTVSKGDPPATEIIVKEVYLAQNHVQKPDDTLFKLVGNREALLKVQVIAPNGTAVPTVTAVLSVDNDTTTLTLDAPDTLHDTFEDMTGKVQHSYEDSFTAVIPAEWIRPGLRIEVTAGNSTVAHDIKVGAPTAVKMHMYDVHYFGLGNNDYPAGTLEELESKWPVSSLSVERIRNINFPELVIPARSVKDSEGNTVYLRNVRVTSRNDYKVQTGYSFDGEQAAALQWVHALSASGGNIDVAMQYINIIGVNAGGQAGGFDGVGGISVGILNHELGHALSLPHWGDYSAYPYKGAMYGIEPQPGVYKGTHAGPAWGFDLRSLKFIPPTVQENSVGGVVGYYKKSPMQGGGTGDQEVGFLMRHFSDYGVNKMRNYLESKVAVEIDGDYYKWNDAAGEYNIAMNSNGVKFPIQQDVQVYSVMASLTLSDPNVNMVYPPIGPYKGNLIRTFDPTNAADRADAALIYAPTNGCDFTLRVVQGGVTKHYMLPASGTEGGDPYSSGSLKTAAVNLPASEGEVTKVELLNTPDVEDNGLPANSQVLYTWTK